MPCEASKHPAYQPCAVIALVVPPAGIVIALLYLGSSLSLDRALGHALIWRSFILPGVVLTVYYLVYLLLLLTPQGRAWVS